MNFKINTLVAQSPENVFAGFTEDLFLALAPPFPKLKLLRFDGCKKDDEVHIELNMLLFKQQWNAKIIASEKLDNEIYFIDFGIKLPFFLRFWEHRHRIIKDEKGSFIVDDITYKTPFLLLDYLMYPLFYLQFAMRKPVYKRLFA
jgi:ligand-binding SRPBCC domain-containing protein